MQGKQKLKNSVEKKIRTTMIGALDAIEKEFGHLFGHGKKVLTDEELENKYIYDALRCRILDLGNEQIRNIGAEFENYEVDGPKYTYDFRIIRK